MVCHAASRWVGVAQAGSTYQCIRRTPCRRPLARLPTCLIRRRSSTSCRQADRRPGSQQDGDHAPTREMTPYW